MEDCETIFYSSPEHISFLEMCNCVVLVDRPDAVIGFRIMFTKRVWHAMVKYVVLDWENMLAASGSWVQFPGNAM